MTLPKITAVNARGSRIITLEDGVSNRPGRNGHRVHFRGAAFANATGEYRIVIERRDGLKGESRMFRVEHAGDAPPPEPTATQRQPGDRPPIDLELGPLYASDILLKHILGAHDQDTFRLRVNLRTRSNSTTTKGLVKARCGYKLHLSSSDMATSSPLFNPTQPIGSPAAGSQIPGPASGTSQSSLVDGIIEIGPFPDLPPNEWQRVPVDIDIRLESAPEVSSNREYYMTFELRGVERNPVRDPNLSNNSTRTPLFRRPAGE